MPNIVLPLVILFGCATLAIHMIYPRRFLRGRYISRPLGRLLGSRHRLQLARGFTGPLMLGTAWIGPGPFVVAVLFLSAWNLDDALTGGDDENDRWDRAWAKVKKLRKPKPVVRRPIQRWAPDPAWPGPFTGVSPRGGYDPSDG